MFYDNTRWYVEFFYTNAVSISNVVVRKCFTLIELQSQQILQLSRFQHKKQRLGVSSHRSAYLAS